mmetsp:Transcript_50445/g.109552  ORF Transcript_50445/g.109552 Transcript_50445/m.109552 type:complete len:266 (+) Transcript_50445:275-1072(+)
MQDFLNHHMTEERDGENKGLAPRVLHTSLSVVAIDARNLAAGRVVKEGFLLLHGQLISPSLDGQFRVLVAIVEECVLLVNAVRTKGLLNPFFLYVSVRQTQEVEDPLRRRSWLSDEVLEDYGRDPRMVLQGLEVGKEGVANGRERLRATHDALVEGTGEEPRSHDGTRIADQVDDTQREMLLEGIADEAGKISGVWQWQCCHAPSLLWYRIGEVHCLHGDDVGVHAGLRSRVELKGGVASHGVVMGPAVHRCEALEVAVEKVIHH